METKKVLSLLILMFFITSLLFPALFVNKIFFIGIFIVMIMKADGQNKIYTISPIIVFSIFLFGYILSFYSYVNRELSNQFMLSVSVLFLIYPVHRYKIDLEPIIKMSAKYMVGLTLFYFLFIFVAPGTPFSALIISIFDKYTLGAYGLRDFSEEATVSFHIGTVPFLYLPLCLYFVSFLKEKKLSKVIIMLLIIIAIVGSASRGILITSFLSLGLIYFFSLKLSTRLVYIGISVPVVIFLISYLITNTVVFSAEEESNGAKIGHITSFFDNLNEINFFIGDGLASYYFSKGVNGLKAHTEVTPVDMLRYFGFILTPILYSVIVFPTKRIAAYLGENKFVTIIFAMYLINTFTNPIMFNSYGLLIVLWYWSRILRYCKEEHQITPQPKLITE